MNNENKSSQFNIVDFACQILEMEEDIVVLRGQVEHYKSLYEMHRTSESEDLSRSQKFMGDTLMALIDRANKGE
tara:strand:+ start:777 stop:998 length:222 start_codon:yes stop_codon:yes gene_type:complete